MLSLPEAACFWGGISCTYLISLVRVGGPKLPPQLPSGTREKRLPGHDVDSGRTDGVGLGLVGVWIGERLRQTQRSGDKDGRLAQGSRILCVEPVLQAVGMLSAQTDGQRTVRQERWQAALGRGRG